MNRNSYKSTLAIAALAGLTFGAAANTASADRASRGGLNNAGPVTEYDGAEIPVVRETEDGSGANDSFENAIDAVAPSDDRFALRGEFGEQDRVCADVDVFSISGLAPNTEYLVTQSGAIGDKMSVGWFAADLSLNSASTGADGKITITADNVGNALLACSAETDGDFDGDADGSAEAHGLCGDYYLTVELAVAGDVNGDDLVDIGDVRAMLGMIGDTGSSSADLTKDGIVDADDLRVLADLVQGKKAKKARKLAIKRAGKLEGMELKAAVAANAELFSATPNDPNAGDSGESSSGRRR